MTRIYYRLIIFTPGWCNSTEIHINTPVVLIRVTVDRARLTSLQISHTPLMTPLSNITPSHIWTTLQCFSIFGLRIVLNLPNGKVR